MQDAIQLEQNTDRLGKEDGSGAILLESGAAFPFGILPNVMKGGGWLVLVVLFMALTHRRRGK